MGPVPLAAGGPPLLLAPAPALFPCVKYKDRHHIAACAVPMYVAVRDPCDRPRHVRCSCDTPKCVMVQICVPALRHAEDHLQTRRHQSAV